MMSSKKLFVIDAMAMAFRNYHAFIQRPLKTAAGLHTSAVYGSLQFVLKLLADEKPDYVIIATDSKEKKTFRHELYPAYKGNRKEMPEDLAVQLPYFFETFAAMDIPVLKEPGMEADDLIGSLVTQYASDDLHCYIVSGDKDFMQLINKNVSLYCPKKNEPAQLINEAGVFEKFGCTPSQVIDVLAIIGDSSDNVPGVHGVGDKGAAKLIQQFQSLEGIYQNLGCITNARMRSALELGRDQVFLSRKLVTIKTDLTLDVNLDQMKLDLNKSMANATLLDLCRRLEFRSLITRLEQSLSVSQVFVSSEAPKEMVLPPQTEPEVSVSNVSHERFGKTYFIANTPERLTRCIQELSAAPAIAFDTETTGLDRIADVPIGISASAAAESGWYIPLLQKHLLEWLTPNIVIDLLKPVFADSTKIKIAHNLKFDLQMFANAKIPIVGPFGDTMLASYVLNPISREHGLDYCSLEFLKFRKIPTSDLMGPKKTTPMSEVPLDLLATYACEDADFVFRLNNFFLERLRQENLLDVYQNIEVPLAPILARMEQEGIYIDSDALGEISVKLDARMKELEARIYLEAGEVFNINSPKQLQVLLFEKLMVHEKIGVKRIKKTKTGYSTDVSVLEALSEHPLPSAILEYRGIAKLKNTYVDTLPQLIHPKTNRVHTNFHQTGTATGRLSSSDPNLQNIPIRSVDGREIRKAFCASAPDRVIISADYSQIELRLLAHIAKDEGLSTAFQNGLDIHTATATKIFAVTVENVTPGLRSNAKAINFGIIYGMGPMRLARDTGVSMSEAKDFIGRYFAGFPRIRDYIDQAKTAVRQLGYSTTMTGRRRPIPEIFAKDRAVMVNGENMAVNSPVQGSAADLMKLAMIAVQSRLDASSLDAKMLLQVHDELVFESSRQDADAVIKLVVDAMEYAMDLSVPLKVEAAAGQNWLDAH